MKLNKIIACAAVSAVAASALAVSASAYNAYIGFQDAVYSFRNAWDDGSYGKDAGNDAFNNVVVWGQGDSPEETFPEYEDNFDYDINGYLLPVTYTDANVTGEGTYTVSVDDFDWALDGATSFNLLFVSTDIPASEYVCTSASIIVDGAVAQTFENPFNNSEDYVNPSFANIWNPDLTDVYTGAYPTKSLAIEFTIAKAAGASDDAAPAATGDVDAATDSSKGSPDTGIADVAAIAGLAVVAGGAIVVAKKRK